MIIQNLNTVYPTTYLKEDHMVLDISTRLAIRELYGKIAAGEDIEDIAVFNAYRRKGKSNEVHKSNEVRFSTLFMPYRPPFEAAGMGMEKTTVAEFEGFLYKKPGYEDYFEQIPVSLSDDFSQEDGECFTKKQLLDYLAAAMEILPELEDKQSLSLEEKLSLSETAKLFYSGANQVSPFNPLPSYEDLVFYNSLSSYEQRLLRNSEESVPVSAQALSVARYCKDEKVNGYGKLFVQEDMFHEDLRTETDIALAVERVADFDRALLKEIGMNIEGLTSRIFRSTSSVLSAQGQLLMESYGIQHLRNMFRNIWKKTPPIDISEIFARHDMEGVRTAVKQALCAAGCLVPAEFMRGYLSGERTATPAEVSEISKDYLEAAAEHFLERGFSTSEDLARFVQEELCLCYPVEKEPLELALEDAFKQKFGRAPKITHDILRAWQAEHASGLDVPAEDVIREITESFRLKNVQAIAKFHSMTLLNMSRDLDFTSIKPAHLQIFATKSMDTAYLKEHGFYPWYEAHRSVNSSELYDLLSCNIEEYSVDKTAKELTKHSRLKRSYEELERIKQAWNVDFDDNDVAIKGRDIVVTDGKFTIEICDRDDPRQATSGYDTNCCQHYGGAGATCVQDILTNPLSCNLIITDNRTGEIAAQSYVWSDISKDALVLDNMEFKPCHDATARKFFPLIAKWCEQMPQKNIHIGTGYNQSFKGVGVPVTTHTACHRTVLGPVSQCYSDYHITGANAARVLKLDGAITFPAADATVSHKELKDSALEAVCGPEDFPLLGIPSIHSAEDICAFKERAALCEDQEWVRNQADMLIATRHMEVLSYFRELPEDLQERAFAADASSVLFLKHPSDNILRKYLTLNPGAVSKFPDLNPDIIRHLYAQNGLLIRKAPTDDLSCQRAAVNNEPLAVKYLKDSPIFGELLLMAVQKDASVIKFFPDAPDTYWNKAIYRGPFIIRYHKHPTRWQRETAIKKNPAVVYSIKNAKPEDFAMAENIMKSYRRRQQPTEEELERENSMKNDYRR